MKIAHLLVLFAIYLCVNVSGVDNTWKGNWFPKPPESKNALAEPTLEQLQDKDHGIKMGVVSLYCDDGKNNLKVDWNGSAEAYTCYDKASEYEPDINTNPIEHCDYIPPNYSALHRCMNKSIEYKDSIPTFGTHRPLWGRYGEYRYLPKQRWLHNAEHGAIVMLYHPCADSQEVLKLKNIVKNCLFRHVITAFNQLSTERPLGLVSWGCRLTMSVVDEDVVKTFIKKQALKGPEKIIADGQYSEELINSAQIITTAEDQVLCPS